MKSEDERNENISGYCLAEMHSNCKISWCICSCHKE